MRTARGRLGAVAIGLSTALGLTGCAAGGRGPAAHPAATGTGAPAVFDRCPPLGRAAPASTALPDLTLPCLGRGPAVPLRALTGTATVINLWASWCVPCRQELPAFQRLYTKVGGRLRVLGVASEDSTGNAQSLAADLGLHFPTTVDADGTLRRDLGRAGLPVTVFVTARGGVAGVYAGPPLSYDRLRTQLAALLGVRVDG